MDSRPVSATIGLASLVRGTQEGVNLVSLSPIGNYQATSIVTVSGSKQPLWLPIASGVLILLVNLVIKEGIGGIGLVTQEPPGISGEPTTELPKIGEPSIGSVGIQGKGTVFWLARRIVSKGLLRHDERDLIALDQQELKPLRERGMLRRGH